MTGDRAYRPLGCWAAALLATLAAALLSALSLLAFLSSNGVRR